MVLHFARRAESPGAPCNRRAARPHARPAAAACHPSRHALLRRRDLAEGAPAQHITRHWWRVFRALIASQVSWRTCAAGCRTWDHRRRRLGGSARRPPHREEPEDKPPVEDGCSCSASWNSAAVFHADCCGEIGHRSRRHERYWASPTLPGGEHSDSRWPSVQQQRSTSIRAAHWLGRLPQVRRLPLARGVTGSNPGRLGTPGRKRRYCRWAEYRPGAQRVDRNTDAAVPAHPQGSPRSVRSPPPPLAAWAGAYGGGRYHRRSASACA